ncbi:MAG: hypothetical protein ABWY63_05985, partial [Hyphomicrobiaceae bacterium]
MSREKPVCVVSRLLQGAIITALIVVACPAASLAQMSDWTPWPTQDQGAKKGAAPKKATPAKPAVATAVEEVVYMGHVVRIRHDAAAATLAIEVNGKVISTVGNVAQFKKPNFLPGSTLSLATIWTNTPAGDCST